MATQARDDQDDNTSFFQVTIRTRNNGEEGEAVFVFETTEPTIDDFMDALVDEDFILGTRYDTRPDGDGVRRVRQSNDCILSKQLILQVTYPSYELRSQSGELLFSPDDLSK
ncbi:hypothetical protein [Paracoccus aerius]|uniref:DUF1488 family protein n=1 Tax=Paracoccus aerius TaxID=1915382 RepID=A0ABS1S699_9RHOB|nr:hypothetical protein [Paracoccus aerius]MBL3674251.1 hypothetical protein [Paracoccus aerius]GHG24383.1 hypothetical protein GCM10017322_22900 [Paracoccus aerius]